MSNKFEKIKIQVLSVKYLREVKNYMPYKDLSKITDIPETVLCRYVRGNILPNYSRAVEILKKLENAKILEKILERIVRIDELGVVNIYSIAFNKNLLTLASIRAFNIFKNSSIDSVLTAAANGIPLASLVSNLLDVDLVVAKKDRDPSLTEVLEAQFISPNPPTLTSLFIPRYSISKNSRVLVVDDLIQSGRTLSALNELVIRSGSRIVSLFAIVSVGRKWRDSLPSTLEKYHIVKRIE